MAQQTIKILDSQFDDVISGVVAMSSVKYQYAFDHLIELIDTTDFQRKLQDKKFYDKLQRDLEIGCIPPPITIAFITDQIHAKSTRSELTHYIHHNIENSFVLDGIQRLNTLSRLDDSEKLDKNKQLYVSFIFCESKEKLLYRMITLNNGQKPMTPRHQVEVMLDNILKEINFPIKVLSEKEASTIRDTKAFKKSDIIQAYLAFMAQEPIIDNKKIIADKMDDLLVGKIMSVEPSEKCGSFSVLLKAISIFSTDPVALKWLKVTNNIIGFAAGSSRNPDSLLSISAKQFATIIQHFDSAFSDFNPSRIKVGKYRRELSCELFKNIDTLKKSDAHELLELFSDLTNDQ